MPKSYKITRWLNESTLKWEFRINNNPPSFSKKSDAEAERDRLEQLDRIQEEQSRQPAIEVPVDMPPLSEIGDDKPRRKMRL